MIVKRIGAIVAAVALIIGAVMLRHSITDSSSGGASPSNGTSASNGTYSVICSTEFAAACNELDSAVFDVVVEPAGITLDRLAKAATNDLPDAWFTLDPFPAMLDDTRTRNSLSNVVQDAAVVGVAEPSLGMLSDRADAFQSACATSTEWRCVGEFAGAPWSDHGGRASWGLIKPGLNDPAIEADGLVQFANAVGGYFDSTDISRRTWETDPRFSSWLRNFTTNSVIVVSGSTPLSTLLVRQSALNIAATSTAEATLVPPSSGTKFALVRTQPAIRFSAVLANIGKPNAALKIELARSLQQQYGWSDPAAAVPALPAGTFIALRQLWKDAT